MTYGWTAPIIPYLISERSHIKTTIWEAEWLETTFMIGAFCGLPPTTYFVNKIGRKRSLLLATVVSFLGWLAIGLADKMVYIFVARFFFGMGANMSFVAAPMYIAEIADQKIRGFLSSMTYLMMLVGFIIVYSVGPYLPFYVIPIIGACIVLVEIATFSFLPESPYYLLLKRNPEAAKKSLQYFRPGRDITNELQEISKAVERQNSEKSRVQDIFLVPSNRKGMIIMTILNGGQPMAAISVILMNLHLILAAAGSVYMDSSIAAIVFSVLMLVAAKIASLQVDKYGRKVLLIISTVGTGICLLALAIYFNLKSNGHNVEGASWIPIVSVMVYAVVFKMGLGIVPIIITAEIFTAKLKALCMTAADTVYVVGAIISLQLYQWLSNSYGLHVPFYLFSITSFAIALFTHYYIPETKGKTLEEIQMILKGKHYMSQVTMSEQTKILNVL